MSRYRELADKVDAFFARVQARHGEDMQCASGCHKCCAAGLTITSVEADAIRAEVATWPDARRRELAVHVIANGCAALDADGRCRVYAARPIICRSHGVPIRIDRAVSACDLNFKRRQPEADCVLDQQTLSAMTLAVDRAASPEPRPRIAITDLLAELAR